MSKISKSKLNQLISLSNSPDIDLIKDDNKEFEVVVKGVKDKMKKSNFENLVLEELRSIKFDVKDIKSRLDILESDVKDIKSRLDILESDVKDIKSLPTIQQELKSKK